MPSPCIYASFSKRIVLMTLGRLFLRLLQYLLPPFLSGLSVLYALFLLKTVLTGLGTEVKGLVLEARAELGIFLVDFHAAYGVLCHIALRFLTFGDPV